MNIDIRIKTTFMYHHKTLKLEKRLGPEGVLALIRLWLYVATNHPKGDISKLDAEDIAAVCLWAKDPSHLLDTLIRVGFIDETLNEDGTVTKKIHDWDEHNRFAYFANERMEIARQNAEKRWTKKTIKNGKNRVPANGLNTPSNANGNAVGMQMAYKTDATGNAPSPIPSPSPSPIPIPKQAMQVKQACVGQQNNVVSSANVREYKNEIKSIIEIALEKGYSQQEIQRYFAEQKKNEVNIKTAVKKLNTKIERKEKLLDYSNQLVKIGDIVK
jgi:AraC-like DNA-binding protein